MGHYMSELRKVITYPSDELLAETADGTADQLEAALATLRSYGCELMLLQRVPSAAILTNKGDHRRIRVWRQFDSE